jgi:hypothetical protein
MYFAVTVFTTTGFGDIQPASAHAKLLVTGQMLLDFVLLAIGLAMLLSRLPVAKVAGRSDLEL